MLLKQTRENKLSPNYEPDPYVVTHKDGNAVVLQDANGNNKMRNIVHTKKFVEPVTIEIEESDKQEQPVQTAMSEQCSPASMYSHPAVSADTGSPT